jgi:integrase
MRVHLLAEWAEVPLSRIDHSSIQRWLVRLLERRAPATVEKCRQLMYGVMSAAVRDRLIASNPVEGVRLPSRRRKSGEHLTIGMHDLTSRLLPAVPARYRALVALAGGTGLRWGECIGLRWDAIREDVGTLRVERVAVEVSGHVTCKPYPKSRAGLRVVPVPPMVMHLLVEHRELYGCGPCGEVFTNEAGTPPRRTLFRAPILAALAGTGWPARPGERSVGEAAVEGDLDGSRRSCGNDAPPDAYAGRHGGRPESLGRASLP